MDVSVKPLNNEKVSYYTSSAVGIASGFAAFKYLPRFVKKPYAKLYLKKCNSITSEEHMMYWNAAQAAFQKSKEYNPNVKVINLNKTNWETIADDLVKKQKQIIEKSKNNPVIYNLKKILSQKEKALKNHIRIAAESGNACYVNLTNQVLVNNEKLGISTFHELGHAINYNTKGFRNMLAKSRVFSFFALPTILGIGLLTPKRAEGDEYTNPAGKTATYIKNHCGLLAGLSFLPIIAEEGIASINGAKLAKSILDKNMYKKVNKLNFFAFGSYVLGAITTGLCAELAVCIKDKMSGTHPIKNKGN